MSEFPSFQSMENTKIACTEHGIVGCRECFGRPIPVTRRCSVLSSAQRQCQKNEGHDGPHARLLGTPDAEEWYDLHVFVAYAGIGYVRCKKGNETKGQGCLSYCGSCNVENGRETGPAIGSGQPRVTATPRPTPSPGLSHVVPLSPLLGPETFFCPTCNFVFPTKEAFDKHEHQWVFKDNIYQPKQYESVDHPTHYGTGKDDPYEHVKVVNAWGLNYQLGNATKYIARCGKKPSANPIEDLEKAKWYIQAEIDRRKGNPDGGT